MGNRLSKIYTRSGDDGTTALADGSRMSKSNLVFAVMGDIDELNSHIGMVRALLSAVAPTMNADVDSVMRLNNSQMHDKTLSMIQHLLFNIGGELAMPSYQGVMQIHIDRLESSIDTMNRNLPHLKDFIIPAGTQLCAGIHIARSICRRAERQAVALHQHNPDLISITSLKFINRLSDWLFVFAREALRISNVDEVLWKKEILSFSDNAD